MQYSYTVILAGVVLSVVDSAKKACELCRQNPGANTFKQPVTG
jgi:hypothetical protein